ncbi:L,D-transpeptidase family protein [Sphingomonas sp. M1-B02]|uniref:L,D-transpeptidase family protein n=1 Tax=Sphingomonas sp. M1-B02 TaxID=3114300 RepID=UPI00223F32AB|nr:L,D-transpeptidase family protein [Sphingomonas sp. S6-11]UZK65611.1 L,D-transpeptidase family protein [Sphingomonas sp. S6-11]
MPIPKLGRAAFAAAGLLATAGPARMQSPGGSSQSPERPMLVVIDIATQRLIAYRGGVPIATSAVSTGKPGHRTPTGVFTILQKAAKHRSNIYSNAPMPFMQRLTWQGIALHGGALPGYPASHGCIRLPHAFASQLFQQTRLGMTVVVIDQRQGSRPARGPQRGERAYWRPDLATSGPVSIVVSGADRRMIVLRNGVQIGSAPVAFDGTIERAQAYVLEDRNRWSRIPLPGDAAAMPVAAHPAGDDSAEADPFRQALAEVVGPGTTMLVVPDSLADGIGALPPPVRDFEDDRVLAAWRADDEVTGGR